MRTSSAVLFGIVCLCLTGCGGGSFKTTPSGPFRFIMYDIDHDYLTLENGGLEPVAKEILPGTILFTYNTTRRSRDEGYTHYSIRVRPGNAQDAAIAAMEEWKKSHPHARIIEVKPHESSFLVRYQE